MGVARVGDGGGGGRGPLASPHRGREESRGGVREEGQGVEGEGEGGRRDREDGWRDKEGERGPVTCYPRHRAGGER